MHYLCGMRVSVGTLLGHRPSARRFHPRYALTILGEALQSLWPFSAQLSADGWRLAKGQPQGGYNGYLRARQGLLRTRRRGMQRLIWGRVMCRYPTTSGITKWIGLWLACSISCTLSFAQQPAEVRNEVKFPNAIHLTREDINGILVGLIGDDPNGIVSLLALKAGLTFRNTGDAGAETWFLVRNFGRDNSRMTLVLLDGRPINLASNHTVEFDDIPINIIESITIYPGPVPVEYGGFQSVIDIRTQRNEDVAFVGANMGSRANYRFTATFGKAGRFYYLANFDLDMSKGQSDQRLEGLLSTFQYTNRELRNFLPNFKVGYEINKHLDVVLQGNFVDFKKMFHTYPMFGSEASRRRMMHNYSAVIRPGRGSSLDYQLVVYQNRERESLNPIFPEDTNYNVHWGNQQRTLTGFRGYYRQRLFRGRLALKAGGEGHWAEGKTDDDYLYFKYVSRQNFYGAYLQSELNLWNGSFITLGLRVDGQNGITKTYVSPVGSVTQAFLGDKLLLYASYGLQSRWIPLNEVNAFNRPARVLGPPFLQGNVLLPENVLSMERLRGVDAGMRLTLWDRKMTVRATYFYLQNEGQFGAPVFEIRPVKPGAPVPPGFGAAFVTTDRNFPGYDISQGLEMEIEAAPLKGLSLFANATYFLESITRRYSNLEVYEGPLGGPSAQPAINNAVGQFFLPYDGRAIIPGAYDWLANFGAIYRPNKRAIINLILRYRGNTQDPIMKFGVDPQVDQIPSSLTIDASLGWDILAREAYTIRAIFSANNILGTRYQTFVHYPMQRRFMSAGLVANLR